MIVKNMLRKFELVIVILSAQNFHGSDATEPFITYDGIITSLIVNPETAIYYVEGTDNITVTRRINVFTESPAYLYYNNPDNSFDNTFIRKIVVVCDWSMVESKKRNDMNLVDDTIKHLDFAANKFNEIETPKIKLHLIGIIIPKSDSIFNSPTVYGVEQPFGSYMLSSAILTLHISSGETVKYIENWLGDNLNSFEGLSYNFFWYRTAEYIKDGLTDYDYQTTYFANVKCEDTNSYPSGAITSTKAQSSYFHVVQMIAQSFGVKDDYQLGCKGIMEPEIKQLNQMSGEWSSCSKSELQRVINNSEYSCFSLTSAISDIPNPTSVANVLMLSSFAEIFYPTYSSDHQFNMEFSGPIFEASDSWDYYRDPGADKIDTYVLNVLLILDYELTKLYNKDYDYINPILQTMEKAAVKVNQIKKPKIKVSLTGIIAPEHPDIFELPALEISRFEGEPCRPILGTLDKLNNWLKDHEKNFRMTPYDLYMFASYYIPCNESNFNTPAKSSVIAHGCNSLGYKSRGMFHYSGFNSNVYAAQVIAKSFKVEPDQQSGCGQDHIMFSTEYNFDYSFNYNFRSWSNCSKTAFERVSKNPRYSCLKMP